MSDFVDRLAQKRAKALPAIPAPSQPMAVARRLVRDLFTAPEGVETLRAHRGDFYRWNRQCWSEMKLADVRKTAYQFLEHAYYTDPKDGKRKPFAPTRRKMDDVLDALRAVVLLDSSADEPTWIDDRAEFAADQIIAMTNGLLHVPTRRLLPHTPCFFNHHALAFAFEPDAPSPSAWLQFLAKLWEHDPSSIEALQEVMGYILFGDTRIQKIFLFVGPKRAGKGTIGRVLTGLLGRHHVAAPTLAGLSTNFGLAPLIGKPLALISDARLSTRADSKIVVERLLSVSGEDSLTIDRKYKDPWTGRLPTRFVILTNELPRLSDASGALTSRFILFVLTKSFYGSEDPRLTDKLLTEAPAILNWALEGLDRLTKRGYFVNPTSGQEAIRQLEDLSSPISAFLRDRCAVDVNATVVIDELWRAWKAWCESDNRSPGTKGIFGRDLRAAVPMLKRERPRNKDGEEDEQRPYHYKGLKLREIYSDESSGPGGPDGPSEPEQGAWRGSGPRGPRDQPMYPPRREDEDDERF